MNQLLTEIMGDISVKVSKTQAQMNLAKGLVLKHMIRTDLPNDASEGTTGYFLNLFNEVTLNMDKLDLKQKLYKNVGIVAQIFRVIELCGGEYMQFAERFRVPKSA